MRVLVTGGAGFVGANLSRTLTNLGADVVVVDDFSTGCRDNLEGVPVEIVEGSILDEAALGRLGRCDAVVHLAALGSVPWSVQNPLSTHDTNTTGTLRVLEAARDWGAHVVVASSASVYGANPAMPKVETLQPMPVSPYAVSKLATESYATAYQRCYDLPTLAFRFFNIYGPLQDPDHPYAAVVPAFTSAVVAGEPLRIHGDGSQTRDFTFVGTVTSTIAEALERRVTSSDPVNLAFGTRYSLLDVVAHLESETGRRLERVHTESRAGDVQDSQADGRRLRQLFPDLRPVALEEGLALTLDWMTTVRAAQVTG